MFSQKYFQVLIYKLISHWCETLLTRSCFRQYLLLGCEYRTVVLWDKKSAPFLQLLQLCHGLGGCVATQLLKPFLLPRDKQHSDGLVMEQNRNTSNFVSTGNISCINTPGPRWNARHCANSFKFTFLYSFLYILIHISLKFIPKSPIHNKLNWSKSWLCRIDMPLPEPMITQVTHTNIRPQVLMSYYNTGVQIGSCTVSSDSVLPDSSGLFNPVLCVSQLNFFWQKIANQIVSLTDVRPRSTLFPLST